MPGVGLLYRNGLSRLTTPNFPQKNPNLQPVVNQQHISLRVEVGGMSPKTAQALLPKTQISI